MTLEQISTICLTKLCAYFTDNDLADPAAERIVGCFRSGATVKLMFDGSGYFVVTQADFRTYAMYRLLYRYLGKPDELLQALENNGNWKTKIIIDGVPCFYPFDVIHIRTALKPFTVEKI